jgi:hypothetical protein
MMTESTKKEIRDIINFIFANEVDFMRRFAKASDDLTSVYLSDERIKLNYIVKSGMHVTDTITWEQYYEWENKLD